MICACKGGGPEGLPRRMSCSDGMIGATVGPALGAGPSQTRRRQPDKLDLCSYSSRF
jgi:hypothetical protein